jgi:hypothetical protein
MFHIGKLISELLRGSGIYHPNPTLGAVICAGAGGGGVGTDWGGVARLLNNILIGGLTHALPEKPVLGG